MRTRATAAIAFGLAAATITGCGSDSNNSPAAPPTPTTTSTAATPVIDPGDGGTYNPPIDPANFVDVIDNPYLPMTVGSRWRYEGTSDGEQETVEIVVTGKRKTVMSVSTFVVRDTVKDADGGLIEDTLDWFAQDHDGNVWYFGEDVKDYEDGKVVSTAGSWEAGVDGALPGIVMPAEPREGDVYRQEFYTGEAEDMMQITATGQSFEVKPGRYDDVIVTRDWTPLEPEVIEEKRYAKGVGRLHEHKIAGGDAVSALVEYTAG